MVEVLRIEPERAQRFVDAHEREALRALYGFAVVPLEERIALGATENGEIAGIASLRIAASLGHLDAIIVARELRGRGIGRALVERACELANYYNCHKMTATVPLESGAERFLVACGFSRECVLAQHAYKVDAAVMRLFLL